VWSGHSCPQKAATDNRLEDNQPKFDQPNVDSKQTRGRPMIVFVCSIFTLACLYYIFFFPGEVYAGEEKTRLGYLRERKEAVYENLRDLNFEYKAGKVPDVDYQSMRASLEEEAAAIMSEIGRLEQAVIYPA
jgi:hypothetical protein